MDTNTVKVDELITLKVLYQPQNWSKPIKLKFHKCFTIFFF